MIDDKDSANISDHIVPGVWAGHICWPVNWIWLYSLLLNLRHKMESYILHGNRLLSSAFLLTVKTSLPRGRVFQWLTQQMFTLSHSFLINLFFCLAATPMLKSTNQDSQDYQAVHKLWSVPGPDIPVSFCSIKVQSAAWHVAYASNPNTWQAEAGLPWV